MSVKPLVINSGSIFAHEDMESFGEYLFQTRWKKDKSLNKKFTKGDEIVHHPQLSALFSAYRGTEIFKAAKGVNYRQHYKASVFQGEKDVFNALTNMTPEDIWILVCEYGVRPYRDIVSGLTDAVINAIEITYGYQSLGEPTRRKSETFMLGGVIRDEYLPDNDWRTIGNDWYQYVKDEQGITSPWWIGATSHYLEPKLRLDYHDETLTAILEQEAERLGYIQERRSDMGGFEPSRNPLFDAWAYRNGEQSTTDFLLDISLWVFTPREGFPKFGVFNWWW